MTLKNTTDRRYLLFVCFAFIALIIGLGSYGLAETSEARYAEIGREMFLSGDYLNPQLLGIFHFHKPPVTYYITTLGYRIFGINEFGARFFLQVAVGLQLLLVYGLAKLLFGNRKTAFLAGLIYFAMPIVLISSRNLTTDAFLTTLVMAAIYCWQYYTNKSKLLFLYLFYVLVGMAMLTKGPVALLIIVVYIVAYKVIYKTGSRINIHHILGLLVCLGISASWYLLVMREHPVLWDYFTKKQIEGRITGASFSERSEPFWYFFPIVIGMLLPWLLGALPRFRHKVKVILDQAKASRLLLIVSVLLLLTFSAFSTKLVLYILPIFWMVAVYIAAQLNRVSGLSRKIISLGHLGLLGMIFLFLMVCWIAQPDFLKVPTLAVIVALLTMLVSGASYYLIDKENTYRPAVIGAMFGASILLISSAVLKNNSSLINSPRDMMRFVNGIAGNNDKTVLVYDYLLTSIPFYTDATYITLKDHNRTTAREVQFQEDTEWKKRLWDVKKAAAVTKLDSLSRKRNTYLLVRDRDKDRLMHELSFLKDNFNSTKDYAKWTIYYNK